MKVPKHPGLLIKKICKDNNLYITDVSKQCKINRQHLHRIINGQRSITVETAIKLGKYFGNDVDDWLSLQLDYDLYVTMQEMKPHLHKIPSLTSIKIDMSGF